MKTTFEVLVEDPEFMKWWGDILRGIHSFRVNEAVLEYVTRDQVRSGAVKEVSKQILVDAWRQDGALDLWTFLINLKLPVEESDDDSE